jgi:hypothetical protein
MPDLSLVRKLWAELGEVLKLAGEETAAEQAQADADEPFGEPVEGGF